MSGHCLIKQLTPIPFLFSVHISLTNHVYSSHPFGPGHNQITSEKAPDDQSEWIWQQCCKADENGHSRYPL